MHAAMTTLTSKLSVASLRVAPSRDARAVPRGLVIECAHKKGTGSTKNGRDSNPKYLGVKKYGEERVETGNIIVRQVGNKVRAKTLDDGAKRGRTRTRRARGRRRGFSGRASDAGECRTWIVSRARVCARESED